MSVHHNFREILAVDPKENQCVGIAATAGRRCRNPLNAFNRECANGLLDAMDRQRSVARANYVQLADAMLCRSQHNCKTKPHLNQKQQTCDDWQGLFRDHVKKLKRRQSIRKSLKVKSVRDGLRAVPVLEAERKITQIPSSTREAAIETDKANLVVTTNQETPRCKDSFTDNTEMISILRSLREEKLRRSRGAEVSSHNTKNEAGSRSEAADPVHPQKTSPDSPGLPDLPSPPRATPIVAASNQGASMPDPPMLSLREIEDETLDPRPIPSTIPSLTAFYKPESNLTSAFNADMLKYVPRDVFEAKHNGSSLRKSGLPTNAAVSAPINSSQAAFDKVFDHNEPSKWPFVFGTSAASSSVESIDGSLADGKKPKIQTDYDTELCSQNNKTQCYGIQPGTELDLSAPDPRPNPVMKCGAAEKSGEKSEEESEEESELCVKEQASMLHDPPNVSVSTTKTPAQNKETWAYTDGIKTTATYSTYTDSPETVATAHMASQTERTPKKTPKAVPRSTPEVPISELPEDKSSSPSSSTLSPNLTSTDPPKCLPSIEISSEDTPPIRNLPPTSETTHPVVSPDLSYQKSLPPFELGFIPRFPNLRPRSRGASTPGSSTRTKSSARSTMSGSESEFVFGSGYKVPPKSFDFGNWLKLSSAARLSHKISIQQDLGAKPIKMPPEALVDERLSQDRFRDLPNEAKEAEMESDYGSSADITASVEESLDTSVLPDVALEQPETPTKAYYADRITGLLTPEATPEPTKPRRKVEHSMDSLKVMPKPSEFQEQDTQLATEAETTVKSNIADDSGSRPVATINEDYGHAIITEQQRYNLRFPSHKRREPATPPASPKMARSHEHTDTSEPKSPRDWLSAAIQRKPLPSSQEAPPPSQETDVPTNFEPPTSSKIEQSRCESQEEIEWEMISKGRSRGFRRNMREMGAKAVNGVKTKVVDPFSVSLGSFATRLESDKAHQSST